MRFSVVENVLIGSLFALPVLVLVRYLARNNGAQQTERVVEPADGGDAVRDDTSDPRHKVFLSHSGAQKNFVEQLCEDLERFDRYPFFDRRRYSLPIREKFPKLIFEAIEHCEVGVVILSEEFFTRSKWPMLELVAMTKHSKRNKLTIIPVFLSISLEQVKDAKNQKGWQSVWRGWRQKDKRINIEEWRGALKALGPVNSLIFDGASEVSFLEKIVTAVCDVVLPDVYHVQGRLRLCKVVRDMIDQATVSKEFGIRLIGLYGVGGIGKTTVCQTLCNEYSRGMQGRVFHAELGSVDDLELLQRALKHLTNMSHETISGLNKGQCEDVLKRELQMQAVFLAIDNMSDNVKSINQVKLFLSGGFHYGSVVVATARSLGVLKMHLLNENSLWEMPWLHRDEAKALFLQHAIRDQEVRAEVDNGILDGCLERCYFRKGVGEDKYFHPLALKVLGIQLGIDKYEQNKWAALLEDVDIFDRQREEEHPIFSILRKSFDTLMSDDQRLFMDVALFLPESNLSKTTWSMFEWMSMVHGTSVHNIMQRLAGLKRKLLLENLGDGLSTRIGMHDLWREFAILESKAGVFGGRTWVYEVEEPSVPIEAGTPSGSWGRLKRMGFKGKFVFMNLKRINFDHFSNIIVLKVVCLFKVSIKLMLDVTSLKHLKSLEVYFPEWPQDDVEDVEVVGLSVVNSLRYLELSGVQISAASTDDLEHLTNLRVLMLSLFEGERLPNLSQLISLEKVNFFCLSRVAAVAGLSSRSTNLSVLTVPDSDELSALEELGIRNYSSLKRSPNLSNLPRLKILRLDGCESLMEVTCSGGSPALEFLYLGGCKSLPRTPDLSNFPRLKTLRVVGCESLTEVTCFGVSPALEELDLDGCKSLIGIQDLSSFPRLKTLRLVGCESLTEVTCSGLLPALEQLRLHGCKSLTRIPDLNNFSRLKMLVRVLDMSNDH